MAITALPTAPSRSSAPSTFADDADTWVAALATFTTEANALQTDVNAKQVTASAAAVAAADSATDSENSSIAAAASAASALASPGTSATSSSTLTPSIGSKSFTLAQTGKSFAVGQFVTVADTTTPTIKFMHGAITAFNAGTGAITVSVINYYGASSGSTWAVSISAPPNLIGARLIPEVISSTTKTMAMGGDYTFTNTSAQTTATFPPTPNPGDEVTIDNRPTNRLDMILLRNGSNIMGISEDHTLTDLSAFTFRYIDATQGWRYR